MARCAFCEIAIGQLPIAKVYETDTVIAFFDKAPIAEFHTLVIPKRHATNIFDVPDDDLRDLISAVRNLSRHYRNALGIRALQIVSSNGEAAQQEAFHIHFHIVPRSKGDGQDITWTPDYTIVERFDELLERIDASRIHKN